MPPSIPPTTTKHVYGKGTPDPYELVVLFNGFGLTLEQLGGPILKWQSDCEVGVVSFDSVLYDAHVIIAEVLKIASGWAFRKFTLVSTPGVSETLMISIYEALRALPGTNYGPIAVSIADDLDVSRLPAPAPG
jgi:hypothetical protein